MAAVTSICSKVWFKSVFAMSNVVALGAVGCEASGIEAAHGHWSTW